MSKTAGIVGGIAERYANALFDLAREAGSDASLRGLFGFAGKDDPIALVEADLESLEQALAASAPLRRMIENPILTRDEQARAMDALAERMGLTGLTRRFLALLAQNRRLFAIGRIAQAFRGLLAAARGEVSAEVTSARALDAHQVALLKRRLVELLGKDVRLASKVDPSLLGGLIVKVGSRMIDSSFKTKLNALQRALKGA
ncbi:MAG: F0F1 ATP synthase subunit delta [Alphaproteobacteria bacterium]|nr:F0F1 ATP synthase subunit delta [Alphaproteobacteria bacterium]